MSIFSLKHFFVSCFLFLTFFVDRTQRRVLLTFVVVPRGFSLTGVMTTMAFESICQRSIRLVYCCTLWYTIAVSRGLSKCHLPLSLRSSSLLVCRLHFIAMQQMKSENSHGIIVVDFNKSYAHVLLAATALNSCSMMNAVPHRRHCRLTKRLGSVTSIVK